MISSKSITKIAVAAVALLSVLFLVLSFFPTALSELDTEGYSLEYTEKLFNTDKIIDINIKMDADKWQEMLDSAMSEEYYKCDVEINGTAFYSVAIRPKGNTSLSSIANDPDNDRYSFKLEFDRFVDAQTCFGLDKLVLNNNYADKTNMKEAIIYDMYQSVGADASLYNYAKISVNGEYWGVYLALEAVEDSFMLRNYGTESGKLYKPDSMNFGGGGGRGGMGGSGANLNYNGSSLDSYSAITQGAVTDSGDADLKRVITALKNVSEGTNIEKYLDVDNLIKYMAVHNFAVNEDSLSGSMAHNYYLYESNGRLNIIPWDYNLAWGGMGGMGSGSGGASGVINDAIDDSWSSTSFFDAFLNDEKYLSLYHECYEKLISEYIDSGRFEEVYNRIIGQIDELVKTDPNAMYTYEEYKEAVKTLYDTVLLRAESVRGQLEGTIPSTTAEQNNAPDTLIDASGIDLSSMGSMGGGGFGKKRESGETND